MERCLVLCEGRNVEVVLVDNGSTDNSVGVLKDLGIPRNGVRCVRVETNIGYGHGILSGLKEAKGEFIGWTHADLQADPFDFVRAVEIIEDEDWSDKLYIKEIGRAHV